MELWHGSPEIVWTPCGGCAGPTTIMGQGFTARLC